LFSLLVVVVSLVLSFFIGGIVVDDSVADIIPSGDCFEGGRSSTSTKLVEKKWHLLLFSKMGEEEEDGGLRCWPMVVVVDLLPRASTDPAPAEPNLAAEEEDAAAQPLTRQREALVATSRSNALVTL